MCVTVCVCVVSSDFKAHVRVRILPRRRTGKRAFRIFTTRPREEYSMFMYVQKPCVFIMCLPGQCVTYVRYVCV